MLEDKDIEKLKEELATKEDLKRFATKENLEQAFSEHTAKIMEIFATKEDLKEAVKDLSTKEDFNKLLTAVDSYAKKADTYFQEMVMLSHKVDRNEKWIQQLADKLGIKLEY